MQFESLKLFCDVARHRSFSQAALANNVSQSAASQIVLQMERRLGVQLINRATRPLQLTELGRAYHDGCKSLVERYFELEASIRNAQAQLDATVQVAAIYSVGLGDMDQYVQRFMAQQPGVKVHIEYLHPDRVYEKVLDGTTDFGLVSFPRKSSKLTVAPWREELMVVACAPGHPLADERTIKPAQLAGIRYIGFDRDLVIRREVDRFLRDQGVAIEVALEFDNIENIKKAVEIGAGVALLPEPTLRKEIEAGTLVAVPLATCRLTRPLGIIHRRHQRLSATAQRFLDLLRQLGGARRPGKAQDSHSTDSDRPHANGSQLGRNGAANSIDKRVANTAASPKR